MNRRVEPKFHSGTMQHAFVIAIAFGVTACSIAYEMPHARDPDTGKFEWMTRPSAYTVAAPVVAGLAVAAFRQGNNDEAHPMFDNGVPTSSATLDRFVGVGLALAAAVLTLTAIDSWQLRTRCTHLEEIEAENNAARAAAGKPAQDQVLQRRAHEDGQAPRRGRRLRDGPNDRGARGKARLRLLQGRVHPRGRAMPHRRVIRVRMYAAPGDNAGRRNPRDPQFRSINRFVVAGRQAGHRGRDRQGLLDGPRRHGYIDEFLKRSPRIALSHLRDDRSCA